jgi:GH18 family chitinase
MAPQSAKNLEKKPKPEVQRKYSKVLIGYVQDFRDPAKINYTKLTHVVFSFAHPTTAGDLLLNGDAALKNLRAVSANAHKHGTKVMLAVGGWYHIQGGESYDYFKTAIANPASRKHLVNELADITDRENLDGIDVDFEHPRSQEDAENLSAFINELSSLLHSKDKELSVAVNSKVHSVTGTELTSVVFDPKMFHDVDHVNIMAYDGQWDDGYNAANLSPYAFSENIVKYWTALFDEHKLPKEKLVLGLPLYAQPEDPSIKQVSYAAIINQNQANAQHDKVEMNETTYYYNGELTIRRKTKLALEHGFGGMMLWEAGHDALGTHSLTSSIREVLDHSKTNTFYAENTKTK